MDPLHQRLKELDPDTFHKLCFQLLKERHPNATLHPVEGASGDEGLDIFEGELSGNPTIWQVKSFPNGVGDSQKGQIRESFNTALRHFKPKNWILCLSVNLDSKAHRWWERYKQSKASIVTVGEMFASQIVHELIHRRTLRNYFFPNVALDPVELKRVLRNTGELTTEQLESITQANVEDYIERLKERDARFNYELVFSGDLGPMLTEPKPRPGLMMSMYEGGKTLNVFARDVEALQQNPPTINLTISGIGIEKFKTLVKTGIEQTFEDTEFEYLGSNIPLFDLPNIKGMKLIVGPTQTFLDRRIKARLTFEAGEQKVEYSFIELAPVRRGTDETELKTVSKLLPFELSLTLLSNRHGRFSYVTRLVGSEIKHVAKFTNAITLLYSGATVTVSDLEQDATLFSFSLKEQAMTVEQQEFYELIADLKQIADRFGLNLKWPREISESDYEAIKFLKELMHGIEYNWESVTFTITKSESNISEIENLSHGMAVRFVQETYEPKPVLFGHQVQTGPVRVTINKAEVGDYDVTLSEFKSAQIGDSVRFKVLPRGPGKLELHTAE
jgi:hypothetical protein